MNDVYDRAEAELLELVQIDLTNAIEQKFLLSDEWDWDCETGFEMLERYQDRAYKDRWLD